MSTASEAEDAILRSTIFSSSRQHEEDHDYVVCDALKYTGNNSLCSLLAESDVQ